MLDLSIPRKSYRIRSVIWFLKFFFFVFGCIGSSLRHMGLSVAARGPSLVVASGGYSIAVVCRLLVAVASLIADHRLHRVQASEVEAHDLSCPAACGILVPGLGVEPASCAMERWFSTTGLPGKSLIGCFCSWKELRGDKMLFFIYSFLQSFCKV